MNIVGWLRAFWRLALFALSTVAMLLLFWMTAVQGDPLRRGIRWRRRWIAYVPRYLGVRIRYAGAVPHIPVLYMANHRSYLDPAAILGPMDAVVITKEEVARWPLIGIAAQAAGVLFVRREDRGSRRAVLEASLDIMGRGLSVLNFPEGTTSMAPHLGEFKPGAFRFAAENDIPVVPVAIEYADRKDAWIGDDTFLRHFFQMFAKRRIYVAVNVGPVLHSRDCDWLMGTTRTWIRRWLDLQDKQPGQ